MIWNGGRVVEGEASLNEIIEDIEIFNNRGIPLRFTCTNNLIEKEHLTDKYANTIIELADNGMNEIIVNSTLLESYLRRKYPDFKYISSTTKCILDKEQVINEGKKYYLTVLDYRFNRNIDFLKILKPEQYEILINPSCGVNCPCRAEHYNQVSKVVLNHGGVADDIAPNGCIYVEGFHNMLEKSQMIKVDELYTIYTDLGFRDFKIEGRNNNIVDVLEHYLYYMIKPEYKDYVRYIATKYAIVGGFGLYG